MDVTLAQGLAPQSYLRPPAHQPGARLQELSYQSQERLEVNYADSAGNAFHLTVERSTSVYTATYDRSGGMDRGGQAHGRGARGYENGLEKLSEGLRGSNEAVRGFRRLLYGLLKAVDPSRAGRWPGVGDLDRSAGSAGVVAASESVTVTLEVTGAPSSDYWSAENTAGRLVDFATSLFAGGDRSAHAEKMAAAMEQGYREAREAFGGALPEIARQTVDLARERLDAWAKEAARPAVAAEPGRLDLAA